ncbi:hypothetical protein ES703_73485 [subsurface metagenome]
MPPAQPRGKPPGPDIFLPLPRYPLPPLPTSLDFPLTAQDLLDHPAGILESCLAPEPESAGQRPFDYQVPELLHLQNLWQPPGPLPLVSYRPLFATRGTPLPTAVDLLGKPVAIFTGPDQEIPRAKLIKIIRVWRA